MNACKILVIDDDEDDVEILANAFLQSGVDAMHHVTTAMEAFMYLETAERECLPKLIITDNFLPGISGKEFLTDLKGMEKYRHIPVVILSTSKTDEEIQEYQRIGILDYVVKPHSYEEYVSVAETIKAKALL
ncbi:response regulator [Flavisolibacter nicotianae]|uniref:response regulator n=1 Tax=Flavisolibacter nicotianae TaxID=2364882 RepID=UPI000EAEE9EC|nr:response regulator [Flavisolibacter nicotianae]